MFVWNDKEQDNFADKDFAERNPHIIIFNEMRVGVIGWQDKIDYLWFGPIFIMPEYQNKAIGSYLVRQFIDKADNRNLPVRLQTLRKNENAKKFYEKLGFKTLSSDDIHYQMEYRK
jgi:GNAT superfamily N-acetyltransferase